MHLITLDKFTYTFVLILFCIIHISFKLQNVLEVKIISPKNDKAEFKKLSDSHIPIDMSFSKATICFNNTYNSTSVILLVSLHG